MFDLKQISPSLTAKFVGVVTILVFNSACAHELFVRPANNDSVAQELSQATPEPSGPAQASTLSETKTPKAKATKHGKHTIAKHAHKAKSHKNMNVARNARQHKLHTGAVASVASTQATPPPPQAPIAPAPEIAPPQIPAPLASAGVQTEIDADSGSHVGMFVIYGIAALAILALIYVAPRARRSGKPKRKLVYNG